MNLPVGLGAARPGHSVETTVRPRLPVDLRLTLRPLRRGLGDPTMREDPGGSWWRAIWTEGGVASARYEPRPGGEVHVTAWGPGAELALDEAPGLIGAGDSLEGFEPAPGMVRELHRRLPGLRMTRTGRVLPVLVAAILEQRITGRESRRIHAVMVRAWGTPAPGPVALTAPPAPGVLAAQPSWAYHLVGLEARRAAVVREAAARARRLEEVAAMAPAEARRLLRSFPGVGTWSAAETALLALGDADAVSTDDYHLPHQVAWALAKEARGSDELMLELLEPYAGHRGRVIRLITASGIRPPRYGPRRAALGIRGR